MEAKSRKIFEVKSREKMLSCPAKEYKIDAAIFHKCNMFKIIPTKHAGSVETSILWQHIEQISCHNFDWASHDTL